MDRKELIEIQREASTALEAGARLAARAAERRCGRDMTDRPSGASLGSLLANPAAFWAGAVAVSADGDENTVQPLALLAKYAATRLAAGDFEYVRESLIGQSQWLSVIAVKLMQQADNSKHHVALPLIKLALAAQRQAAASLATAAALNKLGSGGVSIEVCDQPA